MPIEFHCTACNKLLRVPDGSAGKKAQCPSCQTILEIPAGSSPPKQDPFAAPAGPAGSSPPTSSGQGSGNQGASPFAGPGSSAPSGPTPPPIPPPISDNPFASPLAAASGVGPHVTYGGPAMDNYPLAPRLTRFAGALIDGFIPIVAVVPLFLAMMIGIPMEQNNPDATAFIMFGGLACCGLFFLGICFYQWYLISTTGQSIAKKWLRMRIIRVQDGALPGFVYGVLLRIIVPGLIGSTPFIGGFFGLADALFIFGEERRCIHDHIAGTIVIEV